MPNVSIFFSYVRCMMKKAEKSRISRGSSLLFVSIAFLIVSFFYHMLHLFVYLANFAISVVFV